MAIYTGFCGIEIYRRNKMNRSDKEKELDLILKHKTHEIKICRLEQFVEYNNSTTVLVSTKDGYYEILFEDFLYLLEDAEKHKLVPKYPDEWWEKLCKMYPAKTFFLERHKK